MKMCSFRRHLDHHAYCTCTALLLYISIAIYVNLNTGVHMHLHMHCEHKSAAPFWIAAGYVQA